MGKDCMRRYAKDIRLNIVTDKMEVGVVNIQSNLFYFNLQKAVHNMFGLRFADQRIIFLHRRVVFDEEITDPTLKQFGMEDGDTLYVFDMSSIEWSDTMLMSACECS